MSAIDVSEELLADVKNFLDVTWSDPKSDAKLRGQIRHGISYLVDKTGVAPSAFSGMIALRNCFSIWCSMTEQGRFHSSCKIILLKSIA